jgi:hypothetical protein
MGWVWPVLADVVVVVIEGLACAVVINASLCCLGRWQQLGVVMKE